MATKTSYPRVRNIKLRNPMGELAGIADGRDITRPWIGPLLEPTDSILKGRGRGSFDIYKPILTDPQVKAVFTQRIAAVVSREWTVEAGDDTAQAKKAADWLKDEITNLDWDRLTEKMMWGIFYGYAVSEQMFRRDGQFWGWDEIKVRDRVRFRFDKECELRLITRNNMLNGELMPAGKFWTFSTGADHDDEPYGIGLAHWLYWPVWFKRNGLKLWLIALDKFGMPTAKGTYSSGAEEPEKKILLEAVNAIRSEAGIIVPEGMNIELLSAPSNGSALSFETLHGRMDAAIAKVIRAQTMTTDDGSSLSQAEVHQDVAEYVAKSDADLICESFSRGPVAKLSEFNFPGVAPPQIKRVMTDPEDTTAAVERDKTLYEMGWRMTPERVKDSYGEGYEAENSKPNLNNASSEFSEHTHDGSIDALVREMVSDGYADSALEPLLADIKAALEGIENGDLEALKDKLTELADAQPDARSFADLLGRGMLATRLAGEFGAQVEDEEEIAGIAGGTAQP